MVSFKMSFSSVTVNGTDINFLILHFKQHLTMISYIFHDLSAGFGAF